MTSKRVTIKLMGPLRRPSAAPKGPWVVDVPEQGQAIFELVASLGYEAAEISRLRVLVGGTEKDKSQLVHGGQEITLFLPLGGG